MYTKQLMINCYENIDFVLFGPTLMLQLNFAKLSLRFRNSERGRGESSQSVFDPFSAFQGLVSTSLDSITAHLISLLFVSRLIHFLIAYPSSRD